MIVYRLIFLVLFILFNTLSKAQPGYESMPISLWITDAEDLKKIDCNPKFKVNAEFIRESDLSNNTAGSFTEELTCKYQRVIHMHYNHNTGVSYKSFSDSFPVFYHPCKSLQDDYLVKSITIFRNDTERMKITPPLYILPDQIHYSHGNDVGMPTIVYFKNGEFTLDDVNKSEQKLRIIDKYKKSTQQYHQAPEAQFNPGGTAPKLKAEAKSNTQTYQLVNVSSFSGQPIAYAIVTMYFADSSKAFVKYSDKEATHKGYMYTESNLVRQSPYNIQKITVSAPGYQPEELIPSMTIHDVILFSKSEYFIFHEPFQKIPVHTDNRFLAVLFDDKNKTDTIEFRNSLNELGLEIDTTFNYCGAHAANYRKAMLIRKTDESKFGDSDCKELGMLRKKFPHLNISPKIYSKEKGVETVEKRFFSPLTNRIQLSYREAKPATIEWLELKKVTFSDHPDQRYFEITLPPSWGIRKMNEFSKQAKLSGLFTGVLYLNADVWCL